MASLETLSPPWIEEGGIEPKSTATVEVEATGGHVLPLHKRVLVDRLKEEEADVAREHVSEPHWFWEMLEEAGYDVW